MNLTTTSYLEVIIQLNITELSNSYYDLSRNNKTKDKVSRLF